VLVRRLSITRFRTIEHLVMHPGRINVIIGPGNAGKSTVLTALDLLLHSGDGRPRVLSDLDFYRRETSTPLQVEAVLADLPNDLRAEVFGHLEGWDTAQKIVVPEPDGEGIEPVLRIQVDVDEDLDPRYVFAKEESSQARLSRRVRRRIGWVFDGRASDPARQFAFFQGSILDRLVDDFDLQEALDALRDAVVAGADAISVDPAIHGVLTGLEEDLTKLGLSAQRPDFEAGVVSRRELLQTLRLVLSEQDYRIPIERQGRGTQRLLLVAALLRLAGQQHQSVIAGFDEPEQALEALRQGQLALMLREITSAGGQLFIATHSPDIVRGFKLEDLHLLTVDGARALSELSTISRRHFERLIDGAVVRALFAPVPLLVEGPSDGPVLRTFWQALVDEKLLPPMAHLGLEVINCEGATLQRPMAQLLAEAGKPVVVWCEQDLQPTVLAKLRNETPWSLLLAHDADPGRNNLERSLARGTTIPALAAALGALADDAEAEWRTQRDDLLARINQLSPAAQAVTAQAKATDDLATFLTFLPEDDARELVARALASTDKTDTGRVSPFGMKGARQGRLVAEAIVDTVGVPDAYRRMLLGFGQWLQNPTRPHKHEISMTTPATPTHLPPPAAGPGTGADWGNASPAATTSTVASTASKSPTAPDPVDPPDPDHGGEGAQRSAS